MTSARGLSSWPNYKCSVARVVHVVQPCSVHILVVTPVLDSDCMHAVYHPVSSIVLRQLMVQHAEAFAL